MVAQSDKDLSAIRRQLEFYFSDSNLPRDKFLRAKTEENEEGFVDIEVLLTFSRLKSLSASATSIAAAVADSTLLALNSDSTRIRRTTPLPSESLFTTRAVFAKGWVPDSDPPSIDELTALFNPSGKVLSVRVRKWWGEDGNKHFKGSIFVEMESPEAADRVVAEQYEIQVPTESGQMVKKPLLLMAFDEYSEKKKAESRERAARLKKAQKARGHKRKREDTDAPKTEEKIQCNGSDGPPEAQPASAADGEIGKGLILRFEGFGPDVSREDIREAFEPHGVISYVDFQRGDSEGYIRFETESFTKAAAKAMKEEKVQFGGKDPTFTILEGEAEEAYWKQMWEKRDARIEQAKKRRREGGRDGGGRGRGRRFRGRGKGGPRGNRS
eukprot:GFKZ01004845.1.p1 GENE.GFKZ01004845.1~~GFKZ01004845.1.p1  ORF type:complete len:384 (+),score=82.74 GFKZ01004845.1:199-1350(+)